MPGLVVSTNLEPPRAWRGPRLVTSTNLDGKPAPARSRPSAVAGCASYGCSVADPRPPNPLLAAVRDLLRWLRAERGARIRYGHPAGGSLLSGSVSRRRHTPLARRPMGGAGAPDHRRRRATGRHRGRGSRRGRRLARRGQGGPWSTRPEGSPWPPRGDDPIGRRWKDAKAPRDGAGHPGHRGGPRSAERGPPRSPSQAGRIHRRSPTGRALLLGPFGDLRSGARERPGTGGLRPPRPAAVRSGHLGRGDRRTGPAAGRRGAIGDRAMGPAGRSARGHLRRLERRDHAGRTFPGRLPASVGPAWVTGLTPRPSTPAAPPRRGPWRGRRRSGSGPRGPWRGSGPGCGRRTRGSPRGSP